MANEEGKQLRITIAVDNAALEQFKRAIREVTAEVSKLVETMNRAGGALSGRGSAVTSSAKGGFNTGTQTTPGAQKPIGGILTQPVEGIARAISGVAKGSSEALRQMDRDMTTWVNKQVGNVRTLERSFETFAQKFKSLDPFQNVGGPAMVAGAGPAQFPNMPPMPTTEGTRKNMNNPWLAGGFGMGAPPPPTVQQASGAMPFYQYGGMGQFNMGTLARGMGVGAAAVGAYSYVNNAVVNRDQFLSNEIVQSQFDRLNTTSRINQNLGNFGMQIKNDLATRVAIGKLTPNDIRAALGPETYEALKTKAAIDAGRTGSVSEIAKGGLNRSGAMFNGALGNTSLEGIAGGSGVMPNALPMWARMLPGGDIANFGASTAAGNLQNPETNAAFWRNVGNLPAERLELLRDAIQKRQQSLSVRDQTYIREFQDTHLSRMGLMRQAGVAWGKKRGEDQETNLAMRLGEGTNFTAEEHAGMIANLSQLAGRGLRFAPGVSTGGLLSAQAGGLNNAANIYAIGSQFDNGAGLFNALQGGIGRGGVDITAGGQLGSVVTQAMLQGNNTLSGTGMMEGLLSAAYTGNTGHDMRMARIMGSGVEGLGNIMSGGVDNLQKAINVMAANKAAPGLSVYGKHALEGVGPLQMMQMLRDNSVSPELAARGVTPEMLKAYSQSQQSFAFSRYIGGTGAGGAVEEAALGARGAGGASAYIRSKIGKLQGADRAKAIRQQAHLLGIALADQGLVANSDQGFGAIMTSLDKDLLPTIKGAKGAHDPAGKSLEADTKRSADVQRAAKEGHIGQLKGTIKGANAAAETAEGVGDVFDAQGQQGVNANIKMLNGALGDFIAAINAATKHLKDKTPYANPKGSK